MKCNPRKTIVSSRRSASLHTLVDGESVYGAVQRAVRILKYQGIDATIEAVLSELKDENVTRYQVAACLREMVVRREALIVIRANIATYRYREARA